MPATRQGGVDPADDPRMLTALVQLRHALQAAELPFALGGSDGPRADRAAMIDQLEDYVIPRLMTVEAPLLVVVGGSTGAGKSTLVNSLVGHRVTVPGVLRPTTRSPVLVHHPADAHWFGQDRLLPDLVRVDHTTDDPDSLQLVSSASVPAGVAILDAPDVDSVEERNRELAAQLLAAADLWLFVTSAARYSDQVPWHYLRQAAERSTSVAIVLDRTPDEAVRTVATHLARMLASRGLKDCPLFTVAEGKVDADGVLPPHHVEEIRDWLEGLSEDPDARTAVALRTLDGAIRSLTHRVYPIADAVVGQRDVAVRLHDEAAAVHDAALESLLAASGDGSVLRGDPLARWQEFVGTGELVRSLGRPGGPGSGAGSGAGGAGSRLRERLSAAFRTRPQQQADPVTASLETALVALVLEHAERAAGTAYDAWSGSREGAELLAATGGDLARASRDLRRRTERVVRDWQLRVTDRVRESGGDRAGARYAAHGAGGLGAALMVVALYGQEGVADESVAAGRSLLRAVLGDAAVTALVEESRAAWRRQATALLGEERTRYLSLVDGLALAPGISDRLREAARRVDDLRFAARTSPSTPDATIEPGDH